MRRKANVVVGSAAAAAVAAAAAAALLLAAGYPARAQLKRKRPVVKVKKKYTARSKAALKRRLAPKKIKPTVSPKLRIRWKIQSIIHRQIAILKRRITYTPLSDPKYPEYLLRLASLYNELQNNRWMRAMGLNQPIFLARRAKKPARTQRLVRLQKRMFREHQAWLKKTLTTYRDITRRFPRYGRLDEVFFHISNTAKKLMDREKSPNRKTLLQQIMLTYFRKLLRQFPQSRFRFDAILAYAEYAFSTRNFGAALKLYGQIAANLTSPLRVYAVYKMGWVYLNLKRYHDALRQFLSVLTIRTGRLNLVNEARKDVVRTFAHVGKPAKALQFFRRNNVGGVKHYKWMLIMLADVFYSQGKNKEAIYVYDQAMQQWPRDKDRCKWMLAVVDANINIGDEKRQVTAVRRLGQVRRSMAAQFGPRPRPARQCKSAAANIMKLLATQWHNQGKKTGNAVTLGNAAHLYQTFLSSFPKNSDHYIMSYYYADLLFLVGDKFPNRANWPLAAAAFNKVVRTPRPAKMAHKEYVKRRNAAALAELECWMKHFNLTPEKVTDAPKDTRTADRKKTCLKRKRRKCVQWKKRSFCTPRPIPSDRQKMIEAFDTYIRFVPKSKWLAKIKYNKALIYANYGYCVKAFKLFASLALKHQKDEAPARSAALWVVSILKELKRFGEMKRHIDRFVASRTLMADTGFALRMREYRRNAMWQRAEVLLAQKRYVACGDLFHKIAANNPKDARLGDLYWNAANCYEKARLIGQAVRMRRLLRTHRPNHRYASRALYRIGGNYHALAFYDEASRNYEEYALNNPRHSQAPQALKWAILFRWGTGNIKKMMKNVKAFIETYRRRGSRHAAHVAQVHFWVHKIYEDRKDENMLIHHLTRYLGRSAYRKPGGIDREVEALAKLGHLFWKRSCKRQMIDGMCIKVVYKRKRRRRTATRKKKTVYFLARKPRLARLAKARFEEALRVWRKVTDSKGRIVTSRLPGRTPEEKRRRATSAQYWVAMARFMLADLQVERFMTLKIPRRLDFNPHRRSVFRRSQKRFKVWVQKKNLHLLKLRSLYLQIIKTRQAHWAIAATARIGMLFHNYARQLFNAPIPSHLKTQDEINAYIDEFAKWAGPLEFKAKIGYALCLRTAKKYNWFNDWSRMCEKELNDLDPSRFPLTSELRAQPGFASARPAPGSVATKVQ